MKLGLAKVVLVYRLVLEEPGDDRLLFRQLHPPLLLALAGVRQVTAVAVVVSIVDRVDRWLIVGVFGRCRDCPDED